MDLSSPLQSLIPSLDSAVLEVLAANESGLSATQITRLATRGSRPGHSLVLDRLVEHGLAIAEPANRGHLYRLNRHHVLADSVLSAAAARRTFLHRLTGAVEELDPQPIHASVFGSFARREAGPTSDVDLLVLIGDDASDDEWTDQMHHLGDLVLAWTGNRLEYLVFTIAEFRQLALRDEPFVESWRKDALSLHGASPEEVASISDLRASAGP